MLNFNFFFFSFGGAIIKGAGGHSEEPWRASCACPLRKVIRASWFFHISVQINVSSTINMQRKGSINIHPIGIVFPHSTALHRGLSKYLTAQDTRDTPTITKHNRTLVRLGNLLSLQPRSTIKLYWVFFCP